MITRKKRSLVFVFATLVASCAQDTQRRGDADTYYSDAQQSLLDKKCWNAQQLFRNLLSDYPGSHLVDDAQYGLGQAFFCSKDYETAIFEFERLINEYPVSKFVDQARFQIGMCYFNQSRSIHHDQEETVRAIQEFTRFVEDFPNSDLAPDARKRIHDLEEKLASKDLMIARNYLKWKNPASSEIFCRRILAKYPSSQYLGEARFVLALALQRKGELSEALEILEDLTDAQGLETLQVQIEETKAQVRKALSHKEAGSTTNDVSGQAAIRPNPPGT